MTNEIQEEEYLILIVDDIAKNIQLLGKVLDNQGYGVVAVTNSDQVLKVARKHSPDLILLDIMMPGKSGFEVCQELKADEELAEIPVIFLTARSEEEDVIKGLSLGGSDYVTKPFNSGELLARIDTHLSLKNARDQIFQQRQELQQLSETKDKLYSVIGHDLRSPINAITGFSGLLMDDLADLDDSGAAKQKLDIIYNSALKMAQLLEDLLYWARLQTSSLQFNVDEFELSKVVRDNIELLSINAQNKDVNIQFNRQDSFFVNADERMVKTIVRNLLSNAVKYSESGDVVDIELGRNAGTWYLSVRDEGIGMTEEEMGTLFNGKTNDSKRGTASEKGTGIGLVLSKEMADLHGGSIEVSSEPEQGSTFTLRVPLNLQPND